MIDFRFNRVKKNGRHKYLHDFSGIRKFGDVEYFGFFKCKLVHNEFYSIVIPDQIYVEVAGEMRWIQPLYFLGNSILKFEHYGKCDIYIDISHGICLKISFRNDDLVSKLNDGSLFYRCIIEGPKYIYKYTTGSAKIVKNTPFIRLYHHTTKKSMDGISKSNEFWSSNWNIQGTKQSTNISYLYLTPLPKILCIDDLCEIAMSTHGILGFRVDYNFSDVPDLILNVYRESTENRTHTLSAWVESSLLATQPCYKHMPPDGFGYHAIVCPFIHRIGVQYGTTVTIKNGSLIPKSPKTFDYAVVGDATKVSGLQAPYDEENTKNIFKIEHINDPDEIITFWINNRNSNQYENKNLEFVEFE